MTSTHSSMIAENHQQTLDAGKSLARSLKPGDLVYLIGDLGAGKTTLTQGVLQALGCQDSVKSPTYNLVHSYQFDELIVHHFDLYRIHDPNELDEIGLEDYFTQDAICLVEWPMKGGDYLPAPSVSCTIGNATNHEGRIIEMLFSRTK